MYETKKMKKIDENDDRLNEETEKYAKLKVEFQKLLKERDMANKERELEKMQDLERTDMLSRELDEMRAKYHQIQKQRSNTSYLSDDLGLGGSSGVSSQVRELEFEVRQLKTDNAQLLNQLEELKANAFKHDLDNGRLLLHMSASNAPSLAAEMDIMSKDEVNRFKKKA